MESFVEQFKVCDIKEHAKTKGMWSGTLTPILIPDLYGITNDNSFVEITNYHTPALLKAIDEIIVNATDHTKGCEKNVPSKRVTKISIEFNDGVVSVFNNGPGIPIVKEPNSGLYVIEIAFSKFLTGTNIEKPIDSIKGGINGLGAKLANVHSNLFIVETVSGKQKYSQTFKNRLSDIDDPIIIKTTEPEHTKVTFKLAYEELGYTNDNKTYLSDIDNWIRLRACQVAAYVGEKVEVTYNGTLCKTNSAEQLANIIVDEGENIISAICKNSENGYFINIAAIIMPQGKKVKRRSSAQNMSIINGVISNKGSHIAYIKKIIKEYVTNKMAKLTKGEEKQDLSTNMKLVICGCIPGVDWSGQNKNELQVSNKVLEQYKIPDSFLKTISLTLMGKILVTKKEETKVEHDKYIKAKNISNSKLKKQCLLLVAEGDSAITLLRSGLTQKCNKQASSSGFSPSFDWCGIISLQGVIINAARETTSFSTDDGDINVRSVKLKSNKRLNMLADAFGLRYDFTYTKQEELNTLNYGRMILCVDQDVDGTGKIASLVLVWIYTFWPALLSKKYVGKLMTPLIRAYPKTGKLNKPIEFYYENELDHTLETDSTFVNKHNIKYFKGLATHDSAEATDMFTAVNFNKNVYTYTMDDAADELFKIYFGSDSSLRKKILVTPVNHLTYEESVNLRNTQEIPIGQVQLNIDTKLYKNDAINRQISHAIDGLNPARRKILMGSIMRFSAESKELKVFQLGGYIADKMLYHHGDMSLNKTIIYMAQNFPGARKYPYLIGVGQFGDRHGSKAGSARYIAVKLNSIVHNIFPSEDRWLLPYTFDEGIRAEPEYFVPILPMAVLESYQIVSEGWNHKSYGKSLQSVVNMVKDYIRGNTELIELADKLHETEDISIIPHSIGYKYPLNIDGDIRLYKGNEYSFGNYNYNSEKNVIHITELPINIVTSTYLESLEKLKDKYIDKIEDYSSVTEIEINIYLKPNIIDTIMSTYGDSVIDPIEDLLNLRTSLKPNLNYYSCKRGVLEFEDNYHADILYWAPVRRNLYKARLIRKQILLNVHIIKEESIIRYIEISNELNISAMEDDIIASNILEKYKFPKINSSILTSPGYISNDILEYKLLYDINATYDYILDLKERELTKTALHKRNQDCKRLKTELEQVNIYLNEKPFAGSTLWLQEIDKLIEKIKK